MKRRRIEPIYCPTCMLLERMVLLAIVQVAQLGPLDADRHEVLGAPYWRYRCASCGFVEIHDKLVRESR